MISFSKNKKINFNFIDWLNTRRSNIWIVLLSFFTVLILCIIFFSVSLYLKINKDEAFIVDNISIKAASFKVIDKGELNKIINIFESEVDKFEELKKKKGIYIIDPSL